MTARSVLVVGLGVTGQAVVRALQRRGYGVVVADDQPAPSAWAAAGELGVDLIAAPKAGEWRSLVKDVDLVVPSPGVPDRHEVFRAAASAGVAVASELDLAAEWDHRPCVAVTGTNGKTTVVTLVAAMLEASGIRAVEAGNTEVPLVAAIDDPCVDVFVVEASSFRLAAVERFHPVVATWLNFAPDHQDAHADLAAYEAAKGRIFAGLTADDLAVANADDPVVMSYATSAPRLETFGLRSPADWTVAGDCLLDPSGRTLLRTGQLRRRFPHDVANVLAAAATARGAGASLEGAAQAARAFEGLPHRMSLVAESGGVRWYDDSKATAPHATLAAVGSLAPAVLIAGGRNKGLDLSPLGRVAGQLRAVVAIGEAAEEIVAAFTGHVPVSTAASMDEAVALAGSFAERGDAVVLSPGCASFDWYRSYSERGDDFARAVRQHLEVRP